LVHVVELGHLRRIVALSEYLVGVCGSDEVKKAVFSVKNGVCVGVMGRPKEFCLQKNVFCVSGCMQRALERWLRACGVW
jgi:hypothetical protein